MKDKVQIEQAEARLRTAMLAGDVDALDELLGPDTVFTNQSADRLSKADDIAAHRSGLLRIERIDPQEQMFIRLLGDTAIVCVTVDLAGSYDGHPFGGTFAYTRVWHRHGDDRWQVEAAHCSAAATGKADCVSKDQIGAAINSSSIQNDLSQN